MPDFTHLHVHSHYTLLESTITVPALCQAVAKAGMKAVALTDRGNLLGAVEFQKEAKKAEIKPILGCQVNLAPLGMREKSPDMLQLVLLVRSAKGWSNLVKLVSRGWMEGFHYEPRIDLEALAGLSEDLVCLTGAGRDGLLNRPLQVGAVDEARRQAGLLKEIFPGRLYVELTNHGDEGPTGPLGHLTELARSLELPLVATNWVHYLRRSEAAAQEVLLAIAKATTVDDPRRKRFPSQEFYLKTADEMAALFPGLEEALTNTLVVSEQCAGMHIPTGTYYLPQFDCPDGRDENTHLRLLCEDGLRWRYGPDDDPARRQRLEFELETIIRMKFSGYFLIVADFIGWAKRQGIAVGPGRGSAAGSLVAYILGITDICPLRYGLLFERMLNPGRKSMPDIDIDFCKDRRGEVIDYVAKKYGREAVTQIMTLGRMKARMAIKDVARAYAWEPDEAQQLANLVPNDPSGQHSIAVCLGLKKMKDGSEDPQEALVARYQSDARVKQVLDASMAVENLGRNLGVHACGVIIAPGPVQDFVPICQVKGKPATQFNMTQIEECGLLKMDFLGLKTMSILRRAAMIVQAAGGPPIDFPQVPLDDPSTYALLAEGRTLGVFQCESGGFQDLIRRMRPDRFEDMIALVALYRPGPLNARMHIDYCDRKHGRAKVEYPHPVLEGILRETFGLYIYQEQVMNISRELCGFSPADADNLRKAMGKKDLDVLKKMQEQFIGGAWERHRFPTEKAADMWEKILGFASYCFNKSHSACYGLIAYWTAWMKANHYAAFMTANLIYEMGNTDKMTLFIQELRAQGVPVLPPDLNESGWEFTWTGKAVRFGFGGIKGVGEGAAAHLNAEHTRGGPFRDLFDFCERIDNRTINKRVVEHLIKTGCLDSLHPNRHSLVASIDRAFDRGVRMARTRASSQTTLFADFETDAAFHAQSHGLAEVDDWSADERLAHEKALAGYWMSGHPLTNHRQDFHDLAEHTTRTLTERPAGELRLAAVIVGRRDLKTKNSKRMAVLQLEDEHGRCEAVLFSGRENRRGQYEPGPFERFQEECAVDAVALFVGEVDRRKRNQAPTRSLPQPTLNEDGQAVDPEAGDDDGAEEDQESAELPSLIVRDVVPWRMISERLSREIRIQADANRHGPSQLAATELLFREHPGRCPVRFLVDTGQGVLVTLMLDKGQTVHANAMLLAGLRRIWGPDAVDTLFDTSEAGRRRAVHETSPE